MFFLMGYLKKKRNAFKYAFSGLKSAFSFESNLFIHFMCAFSTVCAAFYLHFSALEWVALLLSIALVIVCELLNTAVELVCDFITTAHDLKIKTIKDISAAAVLFAAIIAFICGIILFLPKIILL